MSTQLRFIILATVCAAGCSNSSAKNKSNRVALETNKGTIVLELNAEKAPITVKNFLDYADAKFYEGTVFHRVIPGFMVQGGGMTVDLKKKPTQPPIKNEASNGLSNARGTVAMARTGVVDSATAQFFINLVDNNRLNHQGPQSFGYCVFGKVVEGMDIVDAIAKEPTDCPSRSRAPCSKPLPPGMRDVPSTPIVIKKVVRR